MIKFSRIPILNSTFKVACILFFQLAEVAAQIPDSNDTIVGEISGISEMEESASFWSSYFLKPKRLTLMQEFSYKAKAPDGIINDRSSIRLEYSKSFLDHWYLQIDSKLTGFLGNDHQAKAKDKDFLLQLRTREAFLQASYGGMSIKAGIQILVWGESDLMSITDIISPRNLSEMLFVPLDELRIGQPMITIDQYSKIGDWSLFFIPIPDYTEYPKIGTEYYTKDMGITAPPKKTFRSKDFEYGLKWKKTFGRSDIGIMATSLIDNEYFIKKQRFSMLGVIFNHAIGTYLLKGEIAMKFPVNFYSLDKSTQVREIVAKDVFETSLALEYYPGSTFSASIEAFNTHIIGWNDKILLYPQNNPYISFVLSDKFLHEDLSVNWATYWKVTNPFFLHILTTSYQVNDMVNLGLTINFPDVKSNKIHMWNYRDQKQINLRFQYKF